MNGEREMDNQSVVDTVRTPTNRQIREFRAALRNRKPSAYPEIQQFIQRKRKEEARQADFSLAVG